MAEGERCCLDSCTVRRYSSRSISVRHCRAFLKLVLSSLDLCTPWLWMCVQVLTPCLQGGRSPPVLGCGYAGVARCAGCLREPPPVPPPPPQSLNPAQPQSPAPPRRARGGCPPPPPPPPQPRAESMGTPNRSPQPAQEPWRGSAACSPERATATQMRAAAAAATRQTIRFRRTIPGAPPTA